ncbi:hypothetical protein LCGC14_0992590 [marine sediment metagenome]|uniref:Uncharacterized protein n=1 Tax=marine sediment metagenome TaxID=412755 RepID=A0A0F9N5H3_9ZZZZ
MGDIEKIKRQWRLVWVPVAEYYAIKESDNDDGY